MECGVCKLLVDGDAGAVAQNEGAPTFSADVCPSVDIDSVHNLHGASLWVDLAMRVATAMQPIQCRTIRSRAAIRGPAHFAAVVSLIGSAHHRRDLSAILVLEICMRLGARDAPIKALQSSHIGAGGDALLMSIDLHHQTSVGVVFQTSCASAMSSAWRLSIDAAFHAGKASSLALIREIDVFWPTSVSATRLRVR